MSPSSVGSSSIYANTPRLALGVKSNINLETSIDTEKTAPSVDIEAVHNYPDGGMRAWLVVLGVCDPSRCSSGYLIGLQVTSGVCATFGFVNAWGVNNLAPTLSCSSQCGKSAVFPSVLPAELP